MKPFAQNVRECFRTANLTQAKRTGLTIHFEKGLGVLIEGGL